MDPWVGVLMLLATALHPATAWSSCKESLPSTDLHALDSSVDVDPVSSVTRARIALQSTTTDPARRAQLFAIMADGFDTLGDDVEARHAVAGGRDALAANPAMPGADRLALRLALVEADTAQVRTELEAAVRVLDGWERRVSAGSLARACLLLVRSRVKSRLTLHEQAAEDGLRAHALAIQLQSRDARNEAAFQLATTFRRAALFDSALQFADEAIAESRASNQPAALASALFVKAQSLDQSGQPAAALEIARESRQLSVALKDDVGRAFADREICTSLLALQRVNEAQPACLAAEAGFAAAGRIDQVVGTQYSMAGIDLLLGRPLVALARLDRALAGDGVRAPPTYLARLYQKRSDALSQLGRSAAALRSMRRSIELTDHADELQRSLAVAVLGAQRRFEQYERDATGLRDELKLERQQAANRELSRRFAVGAAGGSALIAILFAWLLVSARRHTRELHRQEAILRIIAGNSPDTLVLLDANGRVRFASRALFEGGALPQPTHTLAEYFPADVRTAVNEAVERTLRNQSPIELDVRMDSGTSERRYELRGLPIVERGELIGATLRTSDVTERRSMEKRLLDVISRERQRISSELHEGLGQELTGIALGLHGAATMASSGRPFPAEQIEEAIRRIEQAIALTRDLAHGLSPMQADRGSLSDALAVLAADATQRLHVQVTSCSTPPDIVAPEDTADQVYHIAFEAVTNAARHSGGRNVVIDLRAEPLVYVLTVSDDGSGFAAEPERSEGWGMRMMRYRARLLGGTFRVESTPGIGARVIASLPRPPGIEAADQRDFVTST